MNHAKPDGKPKPSAEGARSNARNNANNQFFSPSSPPDYNTLQRVLGNQGILRAMGIAQRTTPFPSPQSIVQRASIFDVPSIQRDWAGDWSGAVDEMDDKHKAHLTHSGQVRVGYTALYNLFMQIVALLKTDFQIANANALVEQFRNDGIRLHGDYDAIKARERPSGALPEDDPAHAVPLQTGIVNEIANIFIEFITAKNLYDNGVQIRPGDKPAQEGVSQPDYGFEVPNDEVNAQLPRDDKGRVLGDAVVVQPPRPPRGFPNDLAKNSAYTRVINEMPAKIASDVNTKVTKYGNGTYVAVNAMAFGMYHQQVLAKRGDIKQAIEDKLGGSNPPKFAGKVYLVLGTVAPVEI